MSGLTLRQLEIFIQVVQHGSFRRCAKEIGVTAVSISEHVRALEQRLGQPLFERQPGGAVRLTPAGRQAYERTRDILLDIDELTRSMTGELSPQQALVSFHPFLSRYLLDGVARFSERHPQVAVRTDLSTESPADMLERVRLSQLTLAFVMATKASAAPDTELVAEEEMGIFVSSDHPLANLSSIGVADIADYPAVLLTPANPLRKLTDDVLAAVGLDSPRSILETDEYGLILTEVAKGRGFVCMFSANADDTQGQGMVELTTRFKLPMIQVRCASSRQLRHSPVLREFRDVLIQTYREGRARNQAAHDKRTQGVHA